MEPSLESSKPSRVLFVCLGNICRSPAAEAVFQHLVNERGLGEGFVVDSAGTSSYHIGEPADKRMRAAASGRGIEVTSRSRMVSPRDFSRFDVLVAMDQDNYRELHKLAGSSGRKVRLLSDFLDDTWPRDVPDPYYGTDDGFDEVLDMLQAAAPTMLAEFSRGPKNS